MRRLSMLMLILLLGACASARPTAAPDGALMAEYPAAFAAQDSGGDSGSGTDPENPAVNRPGKSEGGARALQWLWKGPLNLVWWPWKIIGKGGRGIVDGVSAGFAEGRVPIIGLIVSPVNAVVGLGTGLVEGVGMGPALMTPDNDAGRAFAKPTSVPTNVWWY